MIRVNVRISGVEDARAPRRARIFGFAAFGRGARGTCVDGATDATIVSGTAGSACLEDPAELGRRRRRLA
jgi:hypothetical protein